MLRETPRKARQKKRRVKYVGIGADATELQVSRIHLWLVLTGRRQSRSLLKRYAALKKAA